MIAMPLRAPNKEYINELLGKGTREHERGPLDYRTIKLETGKIPHAEGSALVDIGNTKVLAGVKIGVGTPMPDRPGEGVLMTGGELLPLASPNYETGPPSPDAIEFARVVDRGIRAAGIVDTTKLVVDEEKVWNVYVDLYVLNYDGNLFDAGTLAATSALLSARMPKYEDKKEVHTGNLGRLTTGGAATSCTFAKVEGKVLLDPNGNEEEIMTSRFTVANDESVIRAMQKGLGGSFTLQEIDSMIDATFEKSKSLRDIIHKSVGE